MNDTIIAGLMGAGAMLGLSIIGAMVGWGAYRQKIDDVRANHAATQNEVDALRGDVQKMQIAQARVEGRVDGAESKLAELKTQLSEFRQTVSQSLEELLRIAHGGNK